MTEYTHLNCETEAKKKLSLLVVEKYGQLRNVMTKEVTRAVLNHCKVLEKELAEAKEDG